MKLSPSEKRIIKTSVKKSVLILKIFAFMI